MDATGGLSGRNAASVGVERFEHAFAGCIDIGTTASEGEDRCVGARCGDVSFDYAQMTQHVTDALAANVQRLGRYIAAAPEFGADRHQPMATGGRRRGARIAQIGDHHGPGRVKGRRSGDIALPQSRIICRFNDRAWQDIKR